MFSDFADFVGAINNIISALAPVLFGLAFIGFLWGVSKTILSAGDAGAREEGRKIMLYSVISLFIISALWGILTLARRSLLGF